MQQDDQEQAFKAQQELERLQKAQEEAEANAKAAAAEEEALEVEFDESKANYQENLFFKHNVPPMSNKDIMEAVGLEYERVSYEPKPKSKRKQKTPGKTSQGSAEFGEDLIGEGD